MCVWEKNQSKIVFVREKVVKFFFDKYIKFRTRKCTTLRNKYVYLKIEMIALLMHKKRDYSLYVFLFMTMFANN